MGTSESFQQETYRAIPKQVPEATRVEYRMKPIRFSRHVAEGIANDYAADGRIAGTEILDASERFGDTDVFRQIVLENMTPVRA